MAPVPDDLATIPRDIGSLLLMEAGLMGLSVVVAAVFLELYVWVAFLVLAGVTGAVGFAARSRYGDAPPPRMKHGMVAEADTEVESLLLSAVEEFDTVWVGATRSTSISQALFGSIPEHIGQEHDGTVAMARGGDTTPRTIREAPVDRLSSEN